MSQQSSPRMPDARTIKAWLDAISENKHWKPLRGTDGSARVDITHGAIAFEAGISIDDKQEGLPLAKVAFELSPVYDYHFSVVTAFSVEGRGVLTGDAFFEYHNLEFGIREMVTKSRLDQQRHWIIRSTASVIAMLKAYDEAARLRDCPLVFRIPSDPRF